MSQNDESIPTPQWIELPRYVTANILQRLEALEILRSAEYVCTTWRRICADPAMWRVLHIRGSFDLYWNMRRRILSRHDLYRNMRLRILWRRVVDRSQGQLLDLRIKYIGNDDLLNYIADRSIGLKRLTLNECEVTRKGLNEAVKKFAHLEELHLVIMPSLQAEDIIDIGISCPNLKSFTFNAQGFLPPSNAQGFLPPSRFYTDFAGPINNKYALAIAGNMSNLNHLCLIGNPIGNEGLEAILDGCSNLESLDLRQCYLNLHGALSKRCSEQIKLLKLPSDPVTFVEYRGARNYSVYYNYI